MGTTIIGIDPGLQGAIAALYPSGQLAIYDTPTTVVKGSKRGYLVGDMRSALEAACGGSPAATGDVFAVVEEPSAAPGLNSFRSGLAQGTGVGLWQGLLVGLGVPYELVLPQKWKRPLGLIGQDKGGSVALAQRLFPALAGEFRGPRGGAKDGRAEAALLAEWGRRTVGRA